jgi:hypothetical protein
MTSKERRMLQFLRHYSAPIITLVFLLIGLIAALIKAILREASWGFALTNAALLAIGGALLLLGTAYALTEFPEQLDRE